MMLLILMMVLGLGLAACTSDDEQGEESEYLDVETVELVETVETEEALVEDEDLIPVDELVADLQVRFARDDGFDFTEPLIDVPRDHMFTFDLSAESIEIFTELSHSETGLFQVDDFVRVYRDSALTQEVAFSVGGSVEDDPYLTISPSRTPAFSLRDPAVGGNIFDHGEFNDWGNAGQYFLVKYFDLVTGEELERPQVTVFSVATEIAGAPWIRFSLTEDGIAGLRWDAVHGADEYAVVLVTEKNDGFGIGRHVDIIAYTTETYWYDFSTETGRDNRNFQTVSTSSNLDVLFEAYSELIAAGEMTFDEFIALQYDFESEFDQERTTYLAIIAMNDIGTSAISNLINRRDVAPQVPVRVASNLNEGGIRPIGSDHSRARFEHDLMLAPSHVWLIMGDGSVTRGLINYDMDDVREGTARFYYNEEYDDDGLPIFTDVEEVPALTIPYSIEGTSFRGFVEVLEYNSDTLAEDLQTLAERQEGLRSRTGGLERTINLNPGPEDHIMEDDEADDDDDEDDVSDADADKVATELRGDFDIKRASSPLSAYLAIQMLNSQTRISLDDFPEAADHEYLVEAWFEAVLQNPLVLGAQSMQLDWRTGDMLIIYDHDAATQQRQQRAIMARVEEIVDEIITPGMTDLEMQTAINEFLIEHATYDFGALNNAERNNFMYVDPEYYDSFTAYGILVNGVGVCSGYADAFTLIADQAGLESVIVTGYLQGSLPHAWNRVSIEGEWYTLDVTNNDNEIFPNAFFNLSDKDAATILTEDNRWMLDREIPRFVATSEGDVEYYRYRDRFLDREEIADALAYGIINHQWATYRTDIMLTEDQFYSIALEVMERIGNDGLTGGHFLGIITLVEFEE